MRSRQSTLCSLRRLQGPTFLRRTSTGVMSSSSDLSRRAAVRPANALTPRLAFDPPSVCPLAWPTIPTDATSTMRNVATRRITGVTVWDRPRLRQPQEGSVAGPAALDSHRQYHSALVLKDAKEAALAPAGAHHLSVAHLRAGNRRALLAQKQHDRGRALLLGGGGGGLAIQPCGLIVHPGRIDAGEARPERGSRSLDRWTRGRSRPGCKKEVGGSELPPTGCLVLAAGGQLIGLVAGVVPGRARPVNSNIRPPGRAGASVAPDRVGA